MKKDHPKKNTKRSFAIGSEWVYYKIYTGHKTADTILTEVIAPLADRFLASGSITKWFFIRYADPEHHLRVRFLSASTSDIGTILGALHEPLNLFLERDLIWKIQLDTYQRELERYGTNTIVLSESLFQFDSMATASFLDLIEGDEGETLRWLFGLRSIDHLLTHFSYTLDEKLVLLDHLKTGFGAEFGMGRPLKKQLDTKYRAHRPRIASFMAFTKETDPDHAPILEVLETKSAHIAPIVDDIMAIVAQNLLEMPMNGLLGSYIHMLMNRLFKSKNRLNEMVCYDFLYRYYRTAAAIQKKAGTSS